MKTSRRQFIKNSAIAATGIGLGSSSPLPWSSVSKTIPASDTIVMGLIGCKGMGFSGLPANCRNTERLQPDPS